MMIPRIIKG